MKLVYNDEYYGAVFFASKFQCITEIDMHTITEGYTIEELLNGYMVSYSIVDKDGHCEHFRTHLDDEQIALLRETDQDRAKLTDSVMHELAMSVEQLPSNDSERDSALIHAGAVINTPCEDWGILTPKDITVALNHLLKELACNATRVAELFGISRQYLSELCRGYRKTPNGDEPVTPSRTLSLAICHILNVYS